MTVLGELKDGGGAMMSETRFDQCLQQIEKEYARRREHADAYRDQEMARLFEKSGWTQERIAERMGKTKGWVCLRLTLGRFLAFTTGKQTEFPVENLTERRFRGCWALTDKKTSERERFAQTARLLAEARDSDPGHPHTVNKPGIKKALAEICKDDGGWHNVKQLAELTEKYVPGVSTAQIGKAIQDLQKKPPKGFAVEARHIGRFHNYRMVPRAEVGADASELIAQVRPVLKEIQTELRKSMAAMSTTFLMERVAYIEKVLSHLRDEATVA